MSDKDFYVEGYRVAERAAASEIQRLREENERYRETLEFISQGCGMLNQPAALNAPEEDWLKMRIRECERTAYRALSPQKEHAE